jgi:hypothetical protein
MADGLSTTVANAALNNIVGTNANNIQMHTGAPGPAGTSNVSSVTTRPAVTWASASAGSVAANGTSPEWTSWAGTNGEADTDISFWSAPSSGTFGLSMQLNSPVTMDTGDSLTLTSISITLPTAS